MERRLAAIMAADLVGFARLMGIDEVATLDRLKDLRRTILEPFIAAHSGRVIKLMGDGLLVEFMSAVEAVNCAKAIQREVLEVQAAQPADLRLSLRIGLNLGDVIVDDGDIYGDGVNIAARLESISEPNGICLSRTIVDAIEGKLELALQDIGEQSFKNIARPVHAYRWPRSSSVRATVDDRADEMGKPSIVVLPFRNISRDPEQDYFADGLSEDITTAISRFSELSVIATSTSRAYKLVSDPVQTIARELGVHFALEGQVTRDPTNVRVNVVLSDGQTGRQIWAEKFQSTLASTFDLQDSVTESVVGRIVPEIARAEIRKLRARERVFDEAHDLAWRSRGFFVEALKRGDHEVLEQAISAARAALDQNADCITAYVTLICCLSMRQLYRWTDDLSANRAEAEAASVELMARAGEDSLSYFARGYYRVTDGRFAEGVGDLLQAHEINPNDAWTLIILSRSEAALGQTTEAKRHAERAIRLSPRDDWIGSAYLALAMSAFLEGDYVTARDRAEIAVRHHPTAPIRRALMIACATAANDVDCAERHRFELARFAPEFLRSVVAGENRIFERDDQNSTLIAQLNRC